MKTIRQQRDFAFLKLCRQRIDYLKGQGRAVNLDEVIDFVLLNPAPRYYTDFSRVYTIINKLIKGEFINITNVNTLELYKDLHRDLLAARRRYPRDSDRINLMRLTSGMFGTPRFYISRKKALDMARCAFYDYVA